jgi:hypothetical protein
MLAEACGGGESAIGRRAKEALEEPHQEYGYRERRPDAEDALDDELGASFLLCHVADDEAADEKENPHSEMARRDAQSCGGACNPIVSHHS